jgi:hypothetical protein
MKPLRNKNDIRNILAVLVLAVACGGLLAAFFLYFYGPSGRYLAGNTLLDPKIMNQIHYQEQHLGPGNKVHFEFDSIEFSYSDSKKGYIAALPVSIEAYQKLYSMVASEKSLPEGESKVQDLFLHSRPALLTIRMRVAGGRGRGGSKNFQIVQFIKEDYFRVQLLEKKGGEWAYFYVPGLYEKIIQIFIETRGSTHSQELR